MSNPDYLTQLMDQASEAMGSDYKLAQALGQSRGAISDWRHNRRPCPIEDQILMASMAGLEADKWAVRAIIAKHEGSAKGDMLYKALGKALLATGAAIASSGASAQAIFSPNPITDAVNHFIRCILC